MERVVLVRYGEIMLKGLNRRSFVDKLASNLRSAVASLGKAHVETTQGRVYIEPREKNLNLSEASARARNVFGVVSTSIAYKTGKSHEEISAAAKAAALDYMGENAPAARDGKYYFKVETKRADKSYGRTSPVISKDTGESLLSEIDGLDVDVQNPQFIVYVEVREYAAYAYTEKTAGFGGLPLGTNGKALLLLSGGIDSPVAGFMMAKRGVEIEAVHFYSYPYTGERSKEKVVKITEILAGYMGGIKLNIVPFTKTQLAIRDSCNEEYLTIVMRRAMMYIANIIAARTRSQALVTGESMGQVASQTIQSLAVTDEAAAVPVFRPLIGMDKIEVTNLAMKIGTYDTSILPYDDCCTLFTPKRPRTKPRLNDALFQENKIPDLHDLVNNAADNTECILVKAVR